MLSSSVPLAARSNESGIIFVFSPLLVDLPFLGYHSADDHFVLTLFQTVGQLHNAVDFWSEETIFVAK